MAGDGLHLPRLIGLGRANDLLLTSRVVMTEEAHGIGPGERAVGRSRRAGPHPRLDRGVPVSHGPIQPRGDPAVGLHRPPPARGGLGDQIARPAGRPHTHRGLRRGCPGTGEEPAAGLRLNRSG